MIYYSDTSESIRRFDQIGSGAAAHPSRLLLEAITDSTKDLPSKNL